MHPLIAPELPFSRQDLLLYPLTLVEGDGWEVYPLFLFSLSRWGVTRLEERK